MTDTEQQIPIWLDCDPGHDDAFAILLAAYHPSLHLLGISTVYGNAPLSKTTSNALSVLQAIGKSNIPVHPGAANPFCRTRHDAKDIHGESGLDGTDLLPQPLRVPLSHCNAIQDMRDSLMACPPQTAWLITCGTLTNAGLLFATFPEVSGHIKGLSIMGGALGGGFSSASLGHAFTDTAGHVRPRIGNTTPYAEFNIWCDPEASQSIFRNPVLAPKTVLIPLDLTHQAFTTSEVRDMLLNSPEGNNRPTRLRRMFNELLMFFAQTYKDVFGITEGPPLHDPLAVAVVLASHPNTESQIQFEDRGGERWDVNVILEGEQVGRTVAVATSLEHGVTIPRSLDLDKFWQVIEYCLAEADRNTGYTI